MRCCGSNKWVRQAQADCKGLRSAVDHHVSHDAHVVHASIDLEGVVVEIRHVVVVVIDRNRAGGPSTRLGGYFGPSIAADPSGLP